jgi:hypothetical protein
VRLDAAQAIHARTYIPFLNQNMETCMHMCIHRCGKTRESSCI